MCYNPRDYQKSGQLNPCGKCPQCIARKISSWSFRLMQEDKISSSAYFLTLTYDSKYVPISNDGQLSLCRKDVQLFFKRLRKASSKLYPGNASLKYYAVGEYGGKTRRPHYHIILFNAELELIQPAWDLGHIYYGLVSGASVGYTLKYMSKHKKLRCPKGLQREFSLMSKGLGKSYLSDEMRSFHVKDLVNRMYCTTEGGRKISMPRYYKDKLYDDLQRAAIRDANEVLMHDKELEILEKQTTRHVWNLKQAIDAAYNKMYLSSQKQKL